MSDSATATQPTLAALESALAARFPSLRERCPNHREHTWGCHCMDVNDGLGYVPHVTMDSLLEALRCHGGGANLVTLGSEHPEGIYYRAFYQGHRGDAPTPHEALVRAACIALDLEVSDAVEAR